MRQLLLFLAVLVSAAPFAQAETLRMAVTTSFNNSGLSDILLPEIKADTGIEVQLLVVGTGQALKLGAAGDVDAVLVHSRSAEEAFVAAGNAPHRREIMYNDFVFIGPTADPAKIAGATDAASALRAIATSKAPFISRGDESGTHKMEVSLWRSAKLDPKGAWYREVGAGMGAALRIAVAVDAYVISDRASWLKFGAKGDLSLLFSGDSGPVQSICLLARQRRETSARQGRRGATA